MREPLKTLHNKNPNPQKPKLMLIKSKEKLKLTNHKHKQFQDYIKEHKRTKNLLNSLEEELSHNRKSLELGLEAKYNHRDNNNNRIKGGSNSSNRHLISRDKDSREKQRRVSQPLILVEINCQARLMISLLLRSDQ